MPRVATLSLRDHAGELLAEIARMLLAPRAPSFVRGEDAEVEPDPEDAELDLEAFLDWDRIRGDGRGFFSSDPHECATRRVDLRGPTDLDPGPLPMEEGPVELGPLEPLSAGAWPFAHHRFFPPN